MTKKSIDVEKMITKIESFWLRIKPFVLLGLALALFIYQGCAEDRTTFVATSVIDALEQRTDTAVHVSVGLRTMDGDREDLLGDAVAISDASDEIKQLIFGTGATVTHSFDTIPGLRIDLSSMEDLELLASHPAVERIDLDQGGGGSLARRVAAKGSFLPKGGNISGVGLDGRRVKIAVLDTGINTHHLSFGDGQGGTRIVDQACFCGSDIGTERCCPDDDDPWDQVPGQWVEDDNGHGSHVAGIVASNGLGSPLGVAPGVDIVVVRVMNRLNKYKSSGDLVRALSWIASNHPDVAVVNMSLGSRSRFEGYCDENLDYTWIHDLKDAVDLIRKNGGLVVASSGNNGDRAIEFPACLSNTIAVGVVDDRTPGHLSPWMSTNRSRVLDVAAPGLDIESAGKSVRDAGGDLLPRESSSTVATKSGTSMAVPYVAGAVVLARQLYPEASVSTLELCLRSSAEEKIEFEEYLVPVLNIPRLIDCVGGEIRQDTNMYRSGEKSEKPTNAHLDSVIDFDSEHCFSWSRPKKEMFRLRWIGKFYPGDCE